jgi:DNA-binding transcriptional MerR regulator
MENFSIGVLAERSGVKIPTIRFYELSGLMPAPPRTEGNRRTYDDGAVRRLRFIRHARQLGFEVDAIRQLLDLSDHPDRPCSEADAIARAHLGEIDSRIARLTSLRIEVQRMIAECAHGHVCDCRVIQALADHDKCQQARH